jgi:flagellar basal-body rod modification protein FlgD
VIRDSNSQIVNQFDFGPTPSGTTDFIWDGGDDAGKQVVAGVYTLELTATDSIKAKPLLPAAYVAAMVTSIGQEDSDMKVGLSDGRNILTTDIVKWLAI